MSDLHLDVDDTTLGMVGRVGMPGRAAPVQGLSAMRPPVSQLRAPYQEQIRAPVCSPSPFLQWCM